MRDRFAGLRAKYVTVRGWSDGATAAVEVFLDWVRVERPNDNLVVRILRVALTVDARDRVFQIAGQAFIALVPMVIIVADLVSADDGEAVATWMSQRLELDDATAESVSGLFVTPPDATSSVGVFSVLLVLLSVSSLARTTRRTFDRAWDLPRTTGGRHSVEGLGGILILGVTGFALGWLRLHADLGPWVLSGLLVAFVGWLLACHLFLGGRVRYRDLLAGALYASLAQLVVGWGVGIYLPILIERYLGRYGLIGVSFAMVGWLLIVASLVVSVAVVSAQVAPARLRAARQLDDQHQ